MPVSAKIAKFLGTAPKISPELLPETTAQVARNIKLFSGDLLPYRGEEAMDVLDKPGVIKTIYPMDDGLGGIDWLHWTTDVDVAVAQLENDTTQRIYYTGDGAPKATNYAMATSGTQFPTSSYILGLPIPPDLTAPTAAGFTQLTTATRSRDAANIATLTFSSAHGLKTGAYVTVTSLGGTGYNLTNVPITVTSTTSFTYYSFGTAEGSTADTAGRVDLAGAVGPRTYLYTYYTAWGEESVPCVKSSEVFVREGQTVTVNGLPTTWTHGSGYQTTGMKLRIYRSVSSAANSGYYRVGEIDLGSSSTFVDNFLSNELTEFLESEDYDAPEPTMLGIRAVHNGMMVGFFGNTLCFSEPNKPHAWPIIYRQIVDSPIVALSSFGNTILVATERTPWLFSGSAPSNMSKSRQDYVAPCTSKRSMVNLGFGAAYASNGGLAVYSASVGADFITRFVHSWETWKDAVNEDELVGVYYQGRYFGGDTNSSFIFERNEQVGGFLISTDVSFTAAYYHATRDELYYVRDGVVYLWDSPNKPFSPMEWRSKVFVVKEPVNIGALRIVADFGDEDDADQIEAANNATILANQAAILAGDPMGSFGSIMFDEVEVAGSGLDKLIEESSLTVNFYAGKVLRYTGTVSSDRVIRLPTGYKSDTFEVAVAGNKRVRAIYLAETPMGLKNA